MCEADFSDPSYLFIDLDVLIDRIAGDLRAHGFSHVPAALPEPLWQALRAEVATAPAGQLKAASVGRFNARVANSEVRRDAILWIEGASDAQRAWMAFASRLQVELNRRLLLGLFSFESHFAHYAPGAFYKRHLDAFRGQANRRLSVVAYLNEAWSPEDGGRLVLYDPEHDETTLAEIQPEGGSLVVFLSEEFPHEVLPASKDRFSIAGWFRVNSSNSGRVDPPR